MIKTMMHAYDEMIQRDKDINQFTIENEVFAIQTNIIKNPLTNEEVICSTIFFSIKQRGK